MSRLVSSPPAAAHRGRSRFLPLVWAAGAVSAAVLVLGVSGTLSSWTTAVITNDANTVSTAAALILKEVGPDDTGTPQTCVSSQSAGATNSYTCSTINKYGGTTTPLTPGTNRVIDVTFTNVGSATGASFRLAAAACTQTPVANGASNPVVNNLCTAGAGELGVAVSCSNGATYVAGSAWTDLVYANGAPGSIGTLTHTAALAPNASWTCRFTVTLNTNASPSSQGITVTQPLTWTLA